MIRKVIYRFLRSPFFLFFKRLTSGVIVDQKTGLTFYTSLLTIKAQFVKSSIPSYSRTVAYNFTLAVFPAIIFLFTLIPFLADYLPIKGFTEEVVLDYLESAIPANMFDEVEVTIRDIVLNKQGDLLSFGFFFALLMATNGMTSLMHVFNKLYKTTDKRGFFNRRLVALFLTIMLSLVLVLAVVSIIFGDAILKFVSHYGNYTEKFIDALHDYKALEFMVFTFLFVVAISMIYYFAPAVTHRWKFFSLGSIFSSVCIIAVSMLFSYYINNFGSYNKIYGSIGTLIGFMVWVQSVAYILILGYIVNSGIDEAKMKILLKKSGA